MVLEIDIRNHSKKKYFPKKVLTKFIPNNCKPTLLCAFDIGN